MGIFRRLLGTGFNQEPFQIEVTLSSVLEFTLPLGDSPLTGRSPNFYVDWGDGNEDIITDSAGANRIHTYASAGTYIISIIGYMPSFRVDNNLAIRSLITELIQWGDVGLEAISFYGCNNLTSVPAGYTGLGAVRNFNSAFRNTGLTSIPSDLFQYSNLATQFIDTFSFTRITQVPSGLFDNNTLVTTFNSCFNACSLLTIVPNDLFDNCTIVENFASTFRNCRALTNIPSFDNNTDVLVFSNIFNMSSTSNALSGAAPELWNRVPEPAGFDAFRNCTGLSNYASIPTIWK